MNRPLVILQYPRRNLVLLAAYSAIIVASFYIAYELRFDFSVPLAFQQERFRSIGWVLLLKIVALLIAGQFGSIMTYFSIPDLFRLIWATTGCACVLLIGRFLPLLPLPSSRGVVLVDYLFCLAGLCAARLAARVYRERISRSSGGVEGAPQELIAIAGAGDAGASLAREFINAPSRGFKPVAFFDDDRAKIGKMVHGVPVVGPPELLAEPRTRAFTRLVIAMPTASGKRIREIAILAAQHKLKVETIPSMGELASGRVKTSRIRPVEIEDLLGRESVQLDSDRIRGLIENRTIMVTGAGGSIGSELCRQIASLAPKRLLLIEQAEGNLFLIEQEMNELGMGSLCVPLTANILDQQRMDFIFDRYRPEIVFHAAAHKHVYLMERQPSEAIANNVFGTGHMVELAVRYGVREFVLVSTDKAINPTNVMGASKRLAELVLQTQQTDAAGGRNPTKFIAVRFGNVLGSSGSVIPIFRKQIAAGGPVTVTHPDVTRYFMTIPEAVGLVLQSAVLGKGGEIFVLDMGAPIKIIDLARQMIQLSGLKIGEDIEIKFVGLKPGEKLFEELQHRDESHLPTEHPRIMRLSGFQSLNPATLLELKASLYRLEANELKRKLQAMVPEYTPYID